MSTRENIRLIARAPFQPQMISQNDALLDRIYFIVSSLFVAEVKFSFVIYSIMFSSITIKKSLFESYSRSN